MICTYAIANVFYFSVPVCVSSSLDVNDANGANQRGQRWPIILLIT